MAPQTSAGDSPLAKPKVIYVMGAGRSGSTILGVTLGNCADVFFAGELDKWLPRGGEPKLQRRRARRVLAERAARAGRPGRRSRGQPHRYLERSSALLRVRSPARAQATARRPIGA